MKNEEGKMKNGRKGVKQWQMALIFLFSLFSFLFSCQNPFEPTNPEKPAAGTGYFSLAINQNPGRTILPATVQDDFAAYTLEFFATGTTTNPVTEDRTNADLSDPVELTAGTFDLTVTAYMDAGKTKPAARQSITGIEIVSGETVTREVVLGPIVNSGQGIFSWNISFETFANVASGSMIVTPLDTATGTAAQTVNIKNLPNSNATLNSGYYRVAFKLLNNEGLSVERKETLHIYQNMESAFACTFKNNQFKERSSLTIVINLPDNDEWDLVEQAVRIAADADHEFLVEGTYSEYKWYLDGDLVETESTYIFNEAPGVYEVALVVSNSDGEKRSASCRVTVADAAYIVNNFTDASDSATTPGTLRHAIDNAENGDVIRLSGVTPGQTTIALTGRLEINKNLIMEGNGVIITRDPSWTTVDDDSQLLYITTDSSVIISRIHFKDGRASRNGGGIRNNGTLTVESCIFSGNQTTTNGNGGAIHNYNGTLNVKGCTFYGNRSSENGGAILTDYGTLTLEGNLFFGNTTGAVDDYFVHATVISKGYNVGPSGYNMNWNHIGTDKYTNSQPISPETFQPLNGRDAIGVISSLPEGYPAVDFYGDPISAPAAAGAVQTPADAAALIVNNFTDASGSATTPGTLRHAIANAENGDVIRLSGVTPGQTTIALTSRLDVNKNLIIEGNGVTITRAASWTTVSDSSQLLYNNATVTISRVHFKGGRASRYGAAIYNYYSGNLNLESCIFSGNQGATHGGAVSSEIGTINIKGCTFYGNSASDGGAIWINQGTLTLVGNLFYGNTSGAVYIWSSTNLATVTSLGYNVVDVPLTQSGFTAATGDTTFADLGITYLPLNTNTFAAVTGLGSVIPNPPPEGFPAVDFYGNTRTFPGAPGAVAATFDYEPPEGLTASTASEFATALSAVQSGSDDNVTITILADITLSPQDLSGTAYQNKAITLRGNAATRTVDLSGQGSLFAVGANVELVLEDIVLRGISNNNTSLVKVNTDGKLVLNSGGKITGNTYSTSVRDTGGAGVYVDGGTLEIAGGEISGNTVSITAQAAFGGGGVYAVNGSNILMNSGAIRGNELILVTPGDGWTGGGGISLNTNSRFEMADGVIEGNSINSRATSLGTGSFGGGVWIYGSSYFYFKGGKIRNNTCYSQCPSGYGGATGGGVESMNRSYFFMEGGVISGNSCTSSVNPNYTYGSGGIYAEGAYGGGVKVSTNEGGSFVKTGGIIYGNDAVGNDADGIPLKNTAQSDSSGLGGGHAVFHDNGLGIAQKLRRNSTAYATDNMDSSVSGSAGGWE